MRLLAALESLIQRLRHLAQELLLAYCAADPTAYARLWPQLDEAALFGPADEKTECYLSPPEWRERLLATVAAILNCQHAIRQTAVAGPVQHWLVLRPESSHRVIDDGAILKQSGSLS